MYKERYYGFVELSTWTKSRFVDVGAALAGKLDKAGKASDSTRLDGSTKAQIISAAVTAANLGTKLDVTAQAADSARLGGKTRAEVVAESVVAANLGTKLDVTAKAADSFLLEGKTLVQVIAAAKTASNLDSKLDATATAVNSAKLEGKTKAQVVTEARTGLVQKTDDFGAYKVGLLELSAILNSLAPNTNLVALQTSFNNFVLAKATAQEIITGLDNTKYTTAKAVKAAIVKAIDDLVGTAPGALDTIAELAAAFSNNPNVIQELTDLVNTKLNAIQVQNLVDIAKADSDLKSAAALAKANTKLDTGGTAANSTLLGGRTLAQVIADAKAASNLDGKLDVTGKAADSFKLEGKTKAQVIAESVTAANLGTKLDVTGKAADTTLFDGKTKAQVITETIAAANLGNIAHGDLFISTLEPQPTDGKDGDLWIVYIP